MSQEEWRQSFSLPEYEVSSLGRVRRKPHSLPMPNGGFRIYGGQPWYGAWDKIDRRFVLMFKRKTYRVARLICEAFNGPPPFEDAVACHEDENSRNNLPTNLRWGTQKENMNYPMLREYQRQVCRQKMAGEEIKCGL